jgi:hypothetical protein
MKRPNEFQSQLPLHDYGLALQSALSWLGDRYLLAAPVSARGHIDKTYPAFRGSRLPRVRSRS